MLSVGNRTFPQHTPGPYFQIIMIDQGNAPKVSSKAFMLRFRASVDFWATYGWVATMWRFSIVLVQSCHIWSCLKTTLLQKYHSKKISDKYVYRIIPIIATGLTPDMIFFCSCQHNCSSFRGLFIGETQQWSVEVSQPKTLITRWWPAWCRPIKGDMISRFLL